MSARGDLLSKLDAVEERERQANAELEDVDEQMAFLERDLAMYRATLNQIRPLRRRRLAALDALAAAERERVDVEDRLAEEWDPAMRDAA